MWELGNEDMKLTPEQEAIVQLAKYIDRLPQNEYNVFGHITEILGIKWAHEATK